MASPIQANIATAAANIVPPSQSATQSNQLAQSQSQNNQAQVSQVNAAQSATKVESKERNRSIQVPKRTEGAFSPQTSKKAASRNASAEESESPRKDGDALDVVA